MASSYVVSAAVAKPIGRNGSDSDFQCGFLVNLTQFIMIGFGHCVDLLDLVFRAYLRFS